MAGKLTAAFVRTVNKPGRYGDGHGGYGLALIVRPRADGGVRKSWAQRLRMPTGQITNLGIGPYPIVSLSEARAAALANRRATFRGEDPRGSGAVTFAEAAAAVIAQRSETWRDPRSAGTWASALERYAFPAFGAKPVGEVTSADVLAVVSPLWGAKRETARKLLGRIRAVMAWAIAANLRPDDPTGAVTAALPKNGNGVKHHKALPASAVGDAIAAVQSSGAWWATAACFELIALTAVRSGEARGAVWSEIDLEAETWSIPPERYKTATGLRVPLSGPAVAILTEAQRRTGGGGLVFPGPTGRPLSSGTLSRLLRELGIPGTVHGLRASLRSWCAEAGVSREVGEALLGHVVGGVEGAYMRSDLLEARREVSERWAAVIAPESGA